MIRVQGKIMGLLGQTRRHEALEKAFRLLMTETAIYTTQELRDRMRSVPLTREELARTKGNTAAFIDGLSVAEMTARIAASDARKLAGARRIVAEAEVVWTEFVDKANVGHHQRKFEEYMRYRVKAPELVAVRR